MAATAMTAGQYAEQYLTAGIGVLPIRADGSKSPALARWDEYKKRLATKDEAHDWFSDPSLGVAIVGGEVSGHLFIIDAEFEDIFNEFFFLLREELGIVASQLPLVRTPGKSANQRGMHLYGRSKVKVGTRKLARIGATEAKERTGDAKKTTAIEVKAEGGYVLAPGCPAACHISGRLYERANDVPIELVPVLEEDQVKTILRCARMMDRGDSVRVENGGCEPLAEGEIPNDGERPGDEFNRVATWAEVLEPHGWKIHRKNGKTTYWTRPGKDKGISATTGFCSNGKSGDLLFVFSSNAEPLQDGRAYSKFGAWGNLEHNGDFRKAALDLAVNGYGEKDPTPKGKPEPSKNGAHKADEKQEEPKAEQPKQEQEQPKAEPKIPPRGKGPKPKSPPPEIWTLTDLLKKKFAPPKWAIPKLLSEGLTILAGKPKLGKAQPLDSLVLTQDGMRRMGSLVVGSVVIGADGKSTTVVAIHPQGEKPVFRVTLSDGVSVECTWDHLWKIQTHNDRTTGKDGRVVSTGKMVELLAQGSSRDLYLPMCGPVEFNASDALPIDPYLLGVLLGDGGLTKGVTLSFGDADVLSIVSPLLPDGVRAVVCPSGTTAGLTTPRGAANPLLDSLRRLDLLGKKSSAKFVPEMYLLADQRSRFALIQGLLDTDGGVDGKRATFASTSRKLINAMAWLVQSLGGTARIVRRQTHCVTPTGRKPGLLSWVVCVRLPSEFGCPFRLPRKAASWVGTRPNIKTVPIRRVVSIEPIGVKPCQCITVNNLNGLYLTNDFVVTHNSWLALNLALTLSAGGMALGDIYVEPGDVLYLSLEDRLRRVQDRARKVLHGLESKASERLFITVDFPRQDQGGLEELEKWIQSVKRPALVIIDVWTRFRPIAMGNRSAYDQDYQHITELKKVFDKYGVSCMLVLHCKKGRSEDAIEEVSGTLGLAGGTDGTLVLTRARSETEAELFITGRDVQEQSMALEFNSQTFVWTCHGNAAERTENKIKAAVIKHLKAHAGGCFTVNEIADSCGVVEEKRPALRRMLQRMLDDDPPLVGRVRNGVYRWPASGDGVDE
jgi:hypothetical protein